MVSMLKGGGCLYPTKGENEHHHVSCCSLTIARRPGDVPRVLDFDIADTAHFVVAVLVFHVDLDRVPENEVGRHRNGSRFQILRGNNNILI